MELIARGLACARGGREVFTDLAFTVRPGEALMVTGPNGVGKSSLLRLVAGLVRRTAGDLVLSGGEPEASVGEQAHYVGHLDALKPALSVRENLAFWMAWLGGTPSRETVLEEALAAVGLEDLADLPAGYLSAGQRRRLSLARLAAARRPLWLLDEPTTALDVTAQVRLTTLVRRHLDAGGLAMIATHAPLGLEGAPELRLGDAA